MQDFYPSGNFPNHSDSRWSLDLQIPDIDLVNWDLPPNQHSTGGHSDFQGHQSPLSSSDFTNYSPASYVIPQDFNYAASQPPQLDYSSSKRRLESPPAASPSETPTSAKRRRMSPQTKKNRIEGICIACQMKSNKHACRPGPGPNDPCQACQRRVNTMGLTPCRKGKFENIRLIRLGPTKDFATTFRWVKPVNSPGDIVKGEWKRIADLPAKESGHGYREVQLSQGHSNGTLTLRAQEFVPREDDQTSHLWFFNGKEYRYECRPFALYDTYHASQQIGKFIESNREQYIDAILRPKAQPVKPAATFAYLAFKNALASKSSLVALTIDFWVAGRLIEDIWSIDGKAEETLDMIPDADPDSPFAERIRTHPVMEFQSDNLIIHDHLVPLWKKIMKAMTSKILPIKPSDWFDIHLATFVILHHVDMAMKHDVDFARCHNLPTRHSSQPLIEMIALGANTLLNYHQYGKGYFPLLAPRGNKEDSAHEFTDSQKSYLKEARGLIERISVPQEPGDDLFWALQISNDNWEPVQMNFY